MEDRFDRLEKRIIRIVTLALSAVGLVVVIGVAGIGIVTSAQISQGKKIEETKDEHEDLKRDFGTFLLSTWPKHQDCLGNTEMVQKYNPKRGPLPRDTTDSRF